MEEDSQGCVAILPIRSNPFPSKLMPYFRFSVPCDGAVNKSCCKQMGMCTSCRLSVSVCLLSHLTVCERQDKIHAILEALQPANT